MADPVYYFTRSDLEDALGKSLVTTVFCDDNSDQADTRSITSCRAYGTSECKSFLRANYTKAVFPTTEDTVPDELKFAALDFGIAYAMRRRPELARAMGEESWTTFQKSAIDKMTRYGEGIQRVEPEVATPANVDQSVEGGPEILEGALPRTYFGRGDCP